MFASCAAWHERAGRAGGVDPHHDLGIEIGDDLDR